MLGEGQVATVLRHGMALGALARFTVLEAVE
jgi:hypothetical protein